MRKKGILCLREEADVSVVMRLLCFSVLCLSGCSSKGMVEENERRALLQLRDSLNYPNGSTFIYDWVGDDYCAWQAITCGVISSHVVEIYLSGVREIKLGTWYPNATIISQFKELEYLNLAGNLIGGWVMGEALCGLKNLKYLALWSNRLDDESLPFCLFHNLPLLERLDLSDNNLKGSSSFLSALRGLKNLKYLYLDYNYLDDESLPFCLFHNPPLLEVLGLSWNNLKDSSSLFSRICELRNLRGLDLRHNQLQGGIHPCLGQMNSMTFLDLSYNQFNGSFPSFIISNLTSLGRLYFAGNSFDGILSFSMFANLSKLERIDLSNNEVETESSTWIPSFQLEELYLSNCKLNTRSGHIIPSFISNQHKLGFVDLSYNSLQGTVPSWLLYNNTQLNTLLLSGNSLSGQLPVSSQIQASTLFQLDISDNLIDGQLPNDIDKLFPQLAILNMSQNALEGTIPLWFGNMSNLGLLDLSHNTLRGQIPRRLTWNNTILQVLILSSNNFHGEIMSRFSDMTTLVYLHLQNNGFTGNIPAGMLNMPNLVVLDVSGNNLSGNLSNWFSALPNLKALILARNIFHGEIPVSLCQVQNLGILDLSANYLSGVLPSCLSNITTWKKETIIYYQPGIRLHGGAGWASYTVQIPFKTKGDSLSFEGAPLSLMTGIDLSSNQLSGEIPSSMGELTMLRSINFSHNVLVGHFPESFQNLENLESLDLSYNRLAGILPPQIVQLHFITTFSVAFNNFSGRIPYEKQFSTFSETSYVGNPGLCGLPLKENCSSENPPQHDDQQGKEDKPGIDDSDLFFFSCVAVCYVLGFWAVIAPLILSRNWRRRYYEVVDSCIDLCSEKLFGFWLRVKIYHRN